jgi:hypothetical protein
MICELSTQRAGVPHPLSDPNFALEGREAQA